MPPDPDLVRVQRSALRVGIGVAAVAAAFVIAVIGTAMAWVLWQSTPAEQLERHPDATRVFVDSSDLFGALTVIGAGAIVVAGVTTWFVARRAVGPLGETLSRQRRFVADAGHELRTPITVLSARVQQLERRLPLDEASRSIVAELRVDARELAEIVDDLLDAARPGPDPDPRNTPSGAVGPAVEAALRDVRPLLDARGLEVIRSPRDAARGSTAQDRAVSVPTSALRRCVVAVLDNAIRYSPDGATITVSTTNVSGAVLLEVRDSGPGISGIEPSRVFDRFAHGGSGHGIGLALVRDVVGRHGGTVRVVHTGPHGTTIGLELPTA